MCFSSLQNLFEKNYGGTSFTGMPSICIGMMYLEGCAKNFESVKWIL